MKKICTLFLVLYLLVALAAAQVAVVTHNVNLRPDPSTSHDPIATLATGTKLQLVETSPTNKYLHVKTDDGTEGWVWSRNVQIELGETTTTTITTT